MSESLAKKYRRLLDEKNKIKEVEVLLEDLAELERLGYVEARLIGDEIQWKVKS